MEEELTALMHSEFTIDEETDISHRVGSVVGDLKDSDFTLEELLEDADLTLEQFNKYKSQWK